MFILTIKDKANDGAYAVEKKDGTRILQIFEEQDDAERYVTVSYTHLRAHETS